MDLGDLRLGTTEHRVVEGAREVERRVPQLLEARMAPAQVDRLDARVGEARLRKQLPYPLRIAQREGPRLKIRTPPPLAQAALEQLNGRELSPGVLLDRVPHRQRDAPTGAQH